MLHEMSNKSSYETQKKNNPMPSSLKFSFHITYIFLLTTATITFIESLRSPNPTVRHVLNLETAISLIASYFYSIFLKKIEHYEIEDKKILSAMYPPGFSINTYNIKENFLFTKNKSKNIYLILFLVCIFILILIVI